VADVTLTPILSRGAIDGGVMLESKLGNAIELAANDISNGGLLDQVSNLLNVL